jgi:hypothetical protein
MAQSKALLERIKARINKWGRGTVFTTKDFLDLGSRAAVDKALSRLAAGTGIHRLGRGLYHYPRVNKKLGIELGPDIDEVAQTLARQTGSRIVPTGAVAANWLGLSAQVPARPVYLTDGHSRQVKVGKTLVSIKHAPPKDLPLGSPSSAMVFQALRYLGQDAVTDEVVAQIRARLSPAEQRKLVRDAHHITDWIAEVVRGLAAEGRTPTDRRR